MVLSIKKGEFKPMNQLLITILVRKPSIFIKLLIEKKIFTKLNGFKKLNKLFESKKGIEIGGPSDIFKSKGQLPIYDLAESVDGCNFSEQTTWEGKIVEGKNYHYQQGKTGYQFICDGVDVPIIPKKQYDFVLSCNNLEHIANPLKAIQNWLTLLKEEGTIVLILPRKESNFDHQRPITSMDHLIEDFQKNTGEDDLTHFEEILQLHDLKLDPLAGNFENFKQRGLDNYNNRCLHHHVFDLELLDKICQYFKLQILLKTNKVDNHIIVAKM